MPIFVDNEADLIEALSLRGPDDINIQITASFFITRTHIVRPGSPVIITTSEAMDTVTLTRAPNFADEMFRVNGGADLTIRNMELDGNKAGAGITSPMIFNQNMLHIYDSILKNNSSNSDGGAIISMSGQLDIGNTIFLNNHSAGDGGAICSHNRMTMNSSTFITNSSINNGGGLYYDTPHDLAVFNCRFERNTAVNGGGMYLVRINQGARFDINESSIFLSNRASQDGGAIWTSDLIALYVQQPVIFIHNRAAQGFFIAPADIATHQAQIEALVFTTPFGYGYNNFDINYRSDYPYIPEEQDCDVVGSQTVDICVPVTVKPKAIAGPTKVKCCGPARITSGTNVCPGTPNPDCSFTISQKLCIEVPVEFSADAQTGETHVNCEMATGNMSCNELCPLGMKENAKVAEE